MEKKEEAMTIDFLGSGLLATTVQSTNETELRNGLLQKDQLLGFKYQLLKQGEASAQNLAAALQRTTT